MTEEMLSDLVQEDRLEVCYSPEFLREGSAVADFLDPALSAIGTADGLPPKDRLISELFGGPQTLSWEGAEMLKVACNTFHALKAGFANEMGRLSKTMGLDGARVMELLSGGTKLNASPAYLRPGNPFGGSCLPKDVSALAALARQEGVHLPLIDHLQASNNAHLEALLRQIEAHPPRHVGLLGLSFKPGTDDLRGSPMVAMAETLLGRGYQLAIYDPQVNLTRSWVLTRWKSSVACRIWRASCARRSASCSRRAISLWRRSPALTLRLCFRMRGQSTGSWMSTDGGNCKACPTAMRDFVGRVGPLSWLPEKVPSKQHACAT